MKIGIIKLFFLGLSLMGSWIFSGILLDYAQSIVNKRQAMETEYEASKRYVEQFSTQVKRISELKRGYDTRKKQNTETILIDVLSRFQRKRNDFRLVSIFQSPLGIGLKAEARSAAVVDFLDFCEQEMPDFSFQSISLTAPSIDTRTGALLCEFIFRRNDFEASSHQTGSLTAGEKKDEKIQLLSPSPSLKK
ncbi:hypothetical protein [Methylacidiphilum caldifontis]|uniref:Uncharacterized protein n=1 Tax=Methylacidiphilum caldifontis TaxID=2795386 RepID=A0A4Y8P7I3_9BACT|nr:hypothetical protein [Methylacidiphilum caldifontis]TFE66175.1 hypothetical protein A7Q10_02240 [Methylacidiphilum caldifontis]